MLLYRYALVAAAAASLVGAPAYAQGADQSASPPPADQSASPPPADANASAAPAAATSPGVPTSAVVNGQTVQVVASQPVPDTKANRAQFPPLSRAGRRTRPIGN